MSIAQSASSHITAKIVPRILRRWIERKSETVHGENQFGIRRRKGTRDAVGMLRIISQRTLDVDEELYSCLVNRQQLVDHVKGPN